MIYWYHPILSMVWALNRAQGKRKLCIATQHLQLYIRCGNSSARRAISGSLLKTAAVARPVTNLLHKGVDEAGVFATLQKQLTERPVLVIYDSKVRTEVHTDASKWGLGACLLQLQTDQLWRPVCYYSRTTSVHEQMYHSYELETLAIVEAVKRWCVYLVGVHFTVVTDCSAIRATMLKRDLVPRIASWWMALQAYDMAVQYQYHLAAT